MGTTMMLFLEKRRSLQGRETGRAEGGLMIRNRPFQPNPLWGLPAVLIVAIDSVLLGASWLPLHGLADEASHVLTAMIWLVAARRLGLRLHVLPGLLSAVLIDLDHLPDILGLFPPPEGTSRPATHSLSVVALAVILAGMNPKRRKVWTALAVGLLSHLVRDLGTGTVLVWWPISSDPVSIPYVSYLSVTLVLAMFSLLGISPRRAGSLTWNTDHRPGTRRSGAFALDEETTIRQRIGTFSRLLRSLLVKPLRSRGLVSKQLGGEGNVKNLEAADLKPDVSCGPPVNQLPGEDVFHMGGTNANH